MAEVKKRGRPKGSVRKGRSGLRRKKTAAEIIRREVMAGTDTEEIVKLVKEAFPNSKATATTVSHYRTRMRQYGFDVPRAKRSDAQKKRKKAPARKTGQAGKAKTKAKAEKATKAAKPGKTVSKPATTAPNTGKTVAIASDHAGVAVKAEIKTLLTQQGLTVVDLGTDGAKSVDYPDFANALAQSLAWGEAGRGILICGSGVGISIAANRHRHIRAALCTSGLMARLARQHNDANVLVLGARLTGADIAEDCVLQFLNTPFEGGRHQRRVEKLS